MLHFPHPNPKPQLFKSFVFPENPQVTEAPVFWNEAKFVTEAESWPRRTPSTRPGRRTRMTARPEFLNTYKHIEATRPASNIQYNNDLGEFFLSLPPHYMMHSLTHVRSSFHGAQCRCQEFLLEPGFWPPRDVSGVGDICNSTSCLFLTSMEYHEC